MFRVDRLREHSLGPNALTVARDEMAARGVAITDLVSGNLTAYGLRFPEGALRAALAEADAAVSSYAPDPLGRLDAREAVAAFYAGAGIRVPADRVVMTPGTSVSYLYAFSILCEPGDEVLVPRPSYPLFEEIARIPSARLVPYRLRESDGWRMDLEHLERQISTRTRAVVLISPHNPTGAVASVDEIRELAEIARRHDLAVISDEVFDAFVFDDAPLPRPAAGDAPLVLTLNGLSKRFSLPDWKIGWIAVTGDAGRAAEAAWMLAQVSDAFLPVNERAQAAVPAIFRAGAPVAESLRVHARAGRDAALAALAGAGVARIVPPKGGLFLTVRLAAAADSEQVALDLLRHEHLLVHPGYFYDLDPEHLVLSYAAPAPSLGPALERIATRLATTESRGGTTRG